MVAVAVKYVAMPPPPVLGNDTGTGGAVAVLLAGVLTELPTSASVRENAVAVAGTAVAGIAVAGIAVVTTPYGETVLTGTLPY